MEEYILRQEHIEFTKRMEDEHKRLNRRVGELEDTVRQIGALTASVEKLATNMENMLKNQEAQDDRIEVLESRDGEMWRKAVGYAVTILIGACIGYVLKQIGL